MRRALAVPLCVLALIPVVAEQRQQQPTFRAGVDVVAVDVHVVDGAGRPVPDLRPEEFAITIDGKPRAIVTADYVSHGVDASAALAAQRKPSPVSTSNWLVALPAPGRTIVLVVDEENIRAGYGKRAADAAAAFVDRLQPNDRLGLFIPVSRINIAPTTGHAAVKAALGRVVGHLKEAGAVLIDPRAQAQQIGPAEAFDRHYMNMKEGGKAGPPNPIVEAIVADVRQRAFNSLRSLGVLLDALSAEGGPKTIVLISEELPVSDYIQERAEFNPEFARIGDAAARAQATFYVLQLDRPVVDVDGVQKPSDPRDRDLRSFGLETVVSVTGGERLLVSSRAEPSLERVAVEMSGQYLLGFRSEPADRDGKAHPIKVAVKRERVEVRARKMFAYTADAATRDTDATASVNRVLRAATTETGIPLSVATYSLAEPASGAPQMRVLITAEIDRAATKDAPFTVGYTLTDAAGRNAGAAVEQVTLKMAVGHPDGPLVYTAAALVPPGAYTLRVAAADGALRLGSVTHGFDARPTAAGTVTLSDLVVFDPYVAEVGKPRPSVSGTATGQLTGYLEAYAGGSAPDMVSGRLELADTIDSAPRASAPLDVQPPDGAGRLRMSGSVPLDNVPPGDYIARAIFLTNGSAVGRVVRPVRVAASGAPPRPAQPSDAAVAKPAEPQAPAAPAPLKYTTPAANVGELMPRVASYIQAYAEQMALVIGVERYGQWLQREDFAQAGGGARAISRQLVSEFALVRVGNDWDGFRNVYEVDGQMVPDAKDRMAKLFTEGSASALGQSRKIGAESSRYNLGAMQRNFNVPTVALFFLSAANQARFRFTKDKDDQVGGVRVWKVKYAETRKPTIIRTSDGKDMPVTGEAWIDPIDGRVLKTHMQLDSEMRVAPSANTGGRANNTPERVNTTASVTVTYVFEPKLGILVPAEMLETYEAPMRSAFTGDDNMTKVNCRATYSDFKRFETSARLVTK